MNSRRSRNPSVAAIRSEKPVADHFLAVTAALAFVALAVPLAHARDLTFEERVKAQEAIERVYYSHQIRATRSFEEAVLGRSSSERSGPI